MEYIVQITELLSHRITIEAHSAEEAKQKRQGSYYKDDIELTADDYVDGSVQFEVVWGEQVVRKQSRTTNNS